MPLWAIPGLNEANRRANELKIPDKMLIGSEWCDAADGRRIDVINPFTEGTIGSIPKGGEQDVRRAVKAARKAFETGPWARMSGRERGQRLSRVADLIRLEQECFALLECIDNGKPVQESQWAALVAAEVFEYYGGWADKYHGEVVPLKHRHYNMVVHEPVGVIGAIVPWNFPTIQATQNIVPALAMGNSVILKPAEECSLAALKLGELCLEAGIPDGVVNIVTGLGEEAGAALCEARGVDAVIFTGSTRTGRSVMQAASGTLKRLSLGCSGKSPDLIFQDADLEAAVDNAFLGMFYNQGEVCNSSSRLLIHDSIYAEVVPMITARAGQLKLGDPLDRTTEMGCLVSQEHLDRNLQYIDIGVKESAVLAAGGLRREGRGYFLEPTVFIDVAPETRIFQEEIFGPVLTVTRFRDDDEAVALANNSDYGLAAGVWTRDVKRAQDVASRLQAGTVWVNMFGYLDIASPWTGYKQSGTGTAWGRNALDFVTVPKSIWYAR
ncbi:aldehyde dehydrogenase family protein [Streptomyces sp. NPDC004096]